MGPGFDFQDRFRGFIKADLNALITPHQRELLRQFFGSGPEGAMRRGQDFVVPDGLNVITLACYHEIARRYIAAGQDYTGVQRMRIDLVERALQIREAR